jgi:tektin-4
MLEKLNFEKIFSIFFEIRSNRNAKQNLEMDWSNKLEASVADAKATNRRNEDVDIMFYPGVARHYDK